MNIKYTDSFEVLKKKLESLGGEWSEDGLKKKVLRVDGGVMNWFETTGTLSFQGKEPGLSKLKQNVPNLLYPTEFKKPSLVKENTELYKAPPPKKEKSVEQLYLTGKFSETEIVIGIVNAVGTEYRRVLEPLKDRLKGFGYHAEEIRISTLLATPSVDDLSEYDRIKHYMNEGNACRKNANSNAILAAGAIDKIKTARVPKRKTAYIINSLKHPDEIDFLRRVYGVGFYLFGIHADERRRLEYLMKDKSLTQTEAVELIHVDEDEKIEYGQKTRDTFHLSDFFISLGKNDDQVKSTLERFLELLFSNPFRNPTFDEFAMFMAFNASIRSSDLSRQVGAVISRTEQIIATGANDTPKSGGGQYWATVNSDTGEVTDAPAGKDYTLERDSNKSAQQEIVSEIANSLIKEKFVDEVQREDIQKILMRSTISDLTEFGRVVHAEMEAILSCSRVGISTMGASLYCTTFPCHNCAKHIIDAGIKRVVYVEPYPKSRALELHSDAITLKTSFDSHDEERRVTFEPFTGVGARRFLDLFSINLGGGAKLKRKDKNGDTVEWARSNAVARTPMLPKSYLDLEMSASEVWIESKEG